MTKRVVHLIGNGDMAPMYKPAKGIKVTCNMPPFQVADVYATVMVDFKMMKALSEGSLRLDAYDWVLGVRPKKWMEMRPDFHMKYAKNIKEFYTVLPEYAGQGGAGYTNFNCGHMAAHYCAGKLKADEVHMYGFDSLFDMNLRSVTDLYLNSDRSNANNFRLAENWRPIWQGIFNEFSETKFVIYHKHDNIKFAVGSNVVIDTTRKTK
jgi:hypothetical protein